MAEIPPPKEKIVLKETPAQYRLIRVEARRTVTEEQVEGERVAIIIHYNPIRFPKSNKRMAFLGERRETIKNLVEMIQDIIDDEKDADLLKELNQPDVAP